MSFDYQALKQRVLIAASKCAKAGPTAAQEKRVLDDVASEFDGSMIAPLDFDLQQRILTCWHDLFREGTLSWGSDLDHPGHPFFHIPDRV